VRWVVVSVTIGLALLPACADAERTTERPEGIVERWLVSLNQGASGEPFVYAYDQATATLAPDWDSRDPGAYDRISVGTASTVDGRDVVPFRLELATGGAVGGVAVVVPRGIEGPTATEVRSVTLDDPPPALSGVWSTSADARAWGLALVVAAFLAGVSLLVVGVTRSRD
jgi:hypothetical protein